MSIIELSFYRAMLREVQSTELDMVMQSHLDAAEAEAGQFVGYNILEKFATAELVPANIKTAITLLAQTMTDQLPPDESNIRTARAHSLLRPYRTDTGIAA